MATTKTQTTKNQNKGWFWLGGCALAMIFFIIVLIIVSFVGLKVLDSDKILPQPTVVISHPNGDTNTGTGTFDVPTRHYIDDIVSYTVSQKTGENFIFTYNGNSYSANDVYIAPSTTGANINVNNNSNFIIVLNDNGQNWSNAAKTWNIGESGSTTTADSRITLLEYQFR